jgi:hypothetical protein
MTRTTYPHGRTSFTIRGALINLVELAPGCCVCVHKRQQKHLWCKCKRGVPHKCQHFRLYRVDRFVYWSGILNISTCWGGPGNWTLVSANVAHKLGAGLICVCLRMLCTRWAALECVATTAVSHYLSKSPEDVKHITYVHSNALKCWLYAFGWRSLYSIQQVVNI